MSGAELTEFLGIFLGGLRFVAKDCRAGGVDNQAQASLQSR